MVLNDISNPRHDITTSVERHTASAAILHNIKEHWPRIIATPTDQHVCTKRPKAAGKTDPRDMTSSTIKLTLPKAQAAEVIRIQADPNTATANRLCTTTGQASQPRIDAPVITPTIRALRSIYIASPALAGMSAAELHMWLTSILTPMHGREAAAAAKGCETVAIAAADARGMARTRGALQYHPLRRLNPAIPDCTPP
eukprot:jgi/Tetstr1/440671/TSEL_028980.t1